MKTSQRMRIVAVFLMLVGAGYMAWLYPTLPARLAVHFDLNNRPNGWSDKNTFYALFGALWCGLNVFILGLSAIILRTTPLERANIPWKERWLATPENRALLEDRIKALPAGIATLLNTIFLFCVVVIGQQNRATAAFHVRPLDGLAFLGLIILLFLVWSILLFKPKN